jgi:hypothetical protein
MPAPGAEELLPLSVLLNSFTFVTPSPKKPLRIAPPREPVELKLKVELMIVTEDVPPFPHY